GGGWGRRGGGRGAAAQARERHHIVGRDDGSIGRAFGRIALYAKLGRGDGLDAIVAAAAHWFRWCTRDGSGYTGSARPVSRPYLFCDNQPLVPDFAANCGPLVAPAPPLLHWASRLLLKHTARRVEACG